MVTYKDNSSKFYNTMKYIMIKVFMCIFALCANYFFFRDSICKHFPRHMPLFMMMYMYIVYSYVYNYVQSYTCHKYRATGLTRTN